MSTYVLLLRDDQVFLLQRANTGWMDGAWTVIAGHVEPGERAAEAAVREAGEETGVQIAPEDLHPLGVMHRRTSIDERVDWFYLATRWTGEPYAAEPDKCSGVRWAKLSAAQADPTVLDYVRVALSHPRGELWLDTFGWPDSSASG